MTYRGNFKPTIEEYLAQHDEKHAEKYKQKLLSEARMAIGWGMPNKESFGYPRRDLINIISELVRYIERQ